MSTSEATAESLLSAENRTLKMIANGASLPEVLKDLCRTIEAHAPGVISTVLLMDPDGLRLWPGAGPRFPASLIPAISPWTIGPDRGACGRAAFLKQRVIISDIASDPRWPDGYRTLAISHGLRAAWSEPLISNDGTVLGTFAMYYGEPRVPDSTDLELIQAAGRIALIAIQMEKSQAALRESEESFRLSNAAPVMIRVSGIDKRCTYVNQGWLEFTGRSSESELAKDWADGMHPEDLERCLKTYEQAFERREPFRIEYRLQRKDGEYRWLLDHGVPRFNADGCFAGYIGSAVDITERKLGEEVRFRLAAIMESSNDAIISTNLEGMILGWNSAAQRIYGYTREEAIGQPITITVPRDLHTEAIDTLRRVRAGEYIEPYQTRRVSKDGKTIEVSITVSAIKDAAGRIIGVSKIARDITERKRTEAALHESEERLRLAAQAGKMYAFDWDVVADVIVRSGESTQIFGLTGEPVRLPGHELLLTRVHPEDRARFINSLAECTPESPNTQISYRVLRPDGSVVWLERSGRAFFDEQAKMVRMIGMVADITQRKLAEEKLEEYERAVEGAGEMIAVVDRQYRFRIANNEFVKMRNMTKEQVVGRSAHEVLNKGVFESVVKEKLDECFQGKVVRFEMKYTYPKLGERDILVSYFPIEGATGIDRVACIVRDITERKLAEEALSTVSQKLIEAQEQERTRIARELHDDINQRVALLTVQLPDLKTREVRKQLEDLASDIQALSHRLHSAKLEYLGLEAAVASFCRELSDRQGVEIGFQSENIPKDLPQEVSLTLFRVLQEALQNAVKHSGSRNFQVSLRRGANAIELTAHDSGIGFEPREAIKGRGLGLTSMQERLRLIDGQLSIDSKPQQGTTVHVRVPFHPRTKSAGQVGT